MEQRSRRTAEDQLVHEVDSANFEMWCSMEGLLEVPHIYIELFHRTKTFTTTVQDLVAATIKHAPSRWAEAARLLVDYTVNVLRSEKLGFERFLHSQRESIYWILDDALLRICLDQWEDARLNASWDKVTKPIRVALSDAQEKLPGWAELDFQEMVRIQDHKFESAGVLVRRYFERTLGFLTESTRVYEIWRTVRMSGLGQLPMELADVIVKDVFDFEKLQTGDLRQLYLSKGKGKA